MKDSKEEYHNASKSEKESYQTDLGLQPKVIPENILRKGKEVLDVSGHRRRGSSTKTKGKINPARNVDGRSSFSIVQDGVDCNEMEEITSLDVMMKVQSVFKAEQQFSSQGKFQKDTREVFVVLSYSNYVICYCTIIIIMRIYEYLYRIKTLQQIINVFNVCPVQIKSTKNNKNNRRFLFAIKI